MNTITFGQLISIIAGDDNYSSQQRAMSVLPRLAAQCGIFVTNDDLKYSESRKKLPPVSAEIATRICKLDGQERSREALCKLGEGMAKMPHSIGHSVSGKIELLLAQLTA